MPRLVIGVDRLDKSHVLKGVRLMRIMRRLGVVGAGGAVAIMVLAAAAWACVAGPTLLASPQNVAAGETVQISGISYDEDLPVIVSFGALDGPVLGEFAVDDDGRLAGEVTIPAGTQPGNFVLISTQPSADGQPAIIPSRALVSVVGEGGAPALGAPLADTPAARPATLAQTAGADTGSLILAGVGVAGVALLFAGFAVLVTGRSRPTAEVARTR